jgi:hypothetical protein
MSGTAIMAHPTTNIPASTLALRRLFQWIERRYGGNIPMERGASAAVIRSETSVISTAHLEQLLRHEAVALHVPAFYPPHTARELGRQLAQEAMDGRHFHHAGRTTTAPNNKPQQRPQNWKISTSRGLESSDVTTLGAHVPYNVALTASSSSSASSIDEYFAGVQVELQSRRYRSTRSSVDNGKEQVEPQLWPLDLLRLQLDEAWPHGAGLARDARRNQPFGGGLPRIMHATTTRWKRGLIHVDELGPLRTSEGLFSANIYLQVPPSVSSAGANDTNGGDDDPAIPETVLQIWPTSIRSRWDWYRNALLLSSLSAPQDAEAQAKLRRALGGDTAAQSLAVQPGDLVLFCVQRPHAAVGFGAPLEHASASTALTRVSLQCFIQHAGPGKRLLIDC